MRFPVGYRILQTSAILLLTLAGSIFFTGCERDDICPAGSGDTPMLVIRFYDVSSPDDFKSVTTLKITGEGLDTPFLNRVTTDSVAIPLKSFDTSSTFSFISESESDENDVEIGNEDIVTFNYTTNEVFVSRGCGYISNYDNLTQLLTADASNWIQEVRVEIDSIINQNQAHVKIFH